MDYEILRIVWWGVLGVLLIGFAVMDGFDMGAAALLPIVGRTDEERRIVINAVGPFWEGNQVWLILGAGAIFAAWPTLYAVAFSGFYSAMFVALLALILRPVGFKFRSKVLDARWRGFWDWCLFAGGVVPPVIFGVAFGNALQGVPFGFDDSMRMTYTGSFFGLLNPFALLCGLIGLAICVVQGAGWLAVKAEGPVESRARKAAVVAALAATILFCLAGVLVTHIDGYRFMSEINPAGPSNPLLKTVARVQGAWLDNYLRFPPALLLPLLAVAGAALAIFGAKRQRAMLAFIGGSLLPFGVIGTAGVSMFPFLLPSSLDPNMSLTVWDASSSRGTLITMTIVVALFLPVVVAYTGWVHHVLRGKVTAAFVRKHGENLY